MGLHFYLELRLVKLECSLGWALMKTMNYLRSHLVAMVGWKLLNPLRQASFWLVLEEQAALLAFGQSLGLSGDLAGLDLPLLAALFHQWTQQQLLLR